MTKLAFILLIAATPLPPSSHWKLIWSDEFNGSRNAPPDPSKWTYDLGGGGWGNQELEVYTRNPENIFQDGRGHLAIRARKTSAGAFSSARIKTQGRFAVQFGKIEARIRIPQGQGMWPAFWMLGDAKFGSKWPQCGEIDVMENIGREPSTIHGTVHGPGYSGKDGISSQYSLPRGEAVAHGYHLYTVEWSPDSIQFFFDDHPYAKVTPASLPRGAPWVYNHPFFLLLNLAVGGGWPGNPDATTQFPQTMLVDWVRVWQASK